MNERYTDADLSRMVGPGWQKLVRPLRDEANAKGITILQVKEKLGGLRFYAHPYDEGFQALVNAAERASTTTCEDCGEPGTHRTDGWWRTSCDACEAIPQTPPRANG